MCLHRTPPDRPLALIRPFQREMSRTASKRSCCRCSSFLPLIGSCNRLGRHSPSTDLGRKEPHVEATVAVSAVADAVMSPCNTSLFGNDFLSCYCTWRRGEEATLGRARVPSWDPRVAQRDALLCELALDLSLLNCHLSVLELPPGSCKQTALILKRLVAIINVMQPASCHLVAQPVGWQV